MARVIQIRRGTNAEHENFTGAIGELTMDTDSGRLRVHDGATVGGVQMARRDEIPDLTPFDMIIAWQMPNEDNNYTWYRKYKSGWVEQGGRSKSQTVTFPIAMADTAYSIQMTGDCNTASNNVIVHGWRDLTTTGFTTQGNVLNNKSETSASNTSPKYWWVRGMAA